MDVKSRWGLLKI